MTTSKQLIKKFEQKTEESLTPDEWAILLADEIADCETVEEYVRKIASAPCADDSLFFRPQYILLQPGKTRDDYDICLEKAFRYRRAASLVNIVNIDLVRKNEYESLMLDVCDLRLVLIKMVQAFPSEPVTCDKQDFRESIKQCYAKVMARLGLIRTATSAVDALEKRYFSGHVFVVRSSLHTLHDLEGNYSDMIDKLGEFVPAKYKIAPKTLRPTDESIVVMAKRWEDEAERDAHRLIYNDKQKEWNNFQRIAQEPSVMNFRFVSRRATR